MNFDQLAGLIKAGFNEEQIKNIGSIMDTGTGTNTDTPTPTPTDTPTPTETPKPADTPKPGGTLPSAAQSATPPAEQGPASGATNGGTLTSAAQSPNAENETVTLLKEMLGIIRKGNIDGMGGGALDQPTGSDVLAEILNPTPKK